MSSPSKLGIYDARGKDVVVASTDVKDGGPAAAVVGDRAGLRQIVALLVRHGQDAVAVRALDTDAVRIDPATTITLGRELRRCAQLLAGFRYRGVKWHGVADKRSSVGGVVLPVRGGRECLLVANSVRGEGLAIRSEGSKGVEVLLRGAGREAFTVVEPHLAGQLMFERFGVELGLEEPVVLRSVAGQEVLGGFLTELRAFALTSARAGSALSVQVG